MKYEFSEHAFNVKNERDIKDQWIDETLNNAEVQEVTDDETIHFIRKIKDFGNRYLRVVVNIQSNKYCNVIF
ncbi:MAG: DUF4258 domain-containing protein [Ignavibacteria bacterium]|nr:DUF4258 domain-containing protein [Ignavibacteria bacterium]